MPARDFFIKYRIASLVPNIWLVKKFVWFVIIKWKTHFSFPQMTLLVWLSCICQLSPMWYNIDCSQCLDFIAINFNWSTWPWSIVQWNISSTKLHKPLLIHSNHHSTFSIYCTFFFVFQLHFYLSWNYKA